MAHARVDILDPNTFEKTGVIKTIYDAWEVGDWVGTFNLWIVQNNNGVDSLLYQQRSFAASWAPGMLDVTAGGHYDAGETIEQGLREVREELGKEYDFHDLSYLGKKVYLRDQQGRKLRYAVDVFIVKDNAPLSTFTLERDELEGLYSCPIRDLIKVHTEPNYSFTAEGVRFDGNHLVYGSLLVTKELFPYNWDKYHFKMSLLAQRFLNREPFLIY
jgi:NUDIX domain